MRELIYSFSGGEVSPLLAGRADLPGLRRMARKMRGFIAHPTGPAMRRPSLLNVGDAGIGGTFLVPFNAGTGARYMLEVYDAALKVWTDAGVYVATVESPWRTDQIARIQYIQSNDVMWFVHPDVPVHELQRTPTGWTLNEMPWEWPPLRTENLSPITITPSATTGLINLTASGDIFAPEHAPQGGIGGAYWQISHFRDVAAAELTVQVTPPASAIYSITGIPTDGQTVTIGSVQYTWRTTIAQPYDMTIQADAETTRDILLKAIAGTTDAAIQPGTLPHPLVTGSNGGVSTGATAATATLTINVGPYNGVTYTNLIPGQTIVVAGTTFTAVASGAVSPQFNIGANQEAALDNFITTANALSGTTGVTFSARQGRSTVATATATGVAGNSIAVDTNTDDVGLNWLLWTDSSGAATATLKNGSASDTYRIKVTAKELGELESPIPVADTASNASWGSTQLIGGTDVDAVSDPVTIKGAWTFQSTGRWQGIVYIEFQDSAGNWQIARQFNGRLDVNRTAEGFAETPTVFRIRVKDLAGEATTDFPNPHFILEAAEALVSGIVQIQSVTDGQNATANVISPLQSTDPTPNWREGAFSHFRGFPGSVTLHEERLIFAGVRSEPQKVWGSGAGDFRDFEETGLADGSWQWPFTSQQANPIQYLISGRGLTIGTDGNERTWDSGELGITPMNPPLQRQLTFFGAEAVMPSGAGDVVVFVQKGGSAVREYGYELASQSYIAPDLSQLVEHLMQSGVRQLAVQRNPFTIIWAVMNNGMLLACTYERRDEVVGWCPQNVDGEVVSVACCQGDVGRADAVWIAVSRDGDLRLERFDPDHWTRVAVIPMPITDRVVHLDAAVTGTVTAGALTGLTHLEGQTVSIVVEGVPQPDQAVNGGQVGVDTSLNGKPAIAGLTFLSEFQPALFDVVTQSGSSVGKVYNVTKAHVRFYQTGEAKYKNDDVSEADEHPIKFRMAPSETSHPPAIFNGMTHVLVNGKFLDGISTVLFTDGVHPMNILNLVPEFTIYGPP